MITGTISASLAFCLPSATGPNALVFSFKEITVLDMVSLSDDFSSFCPPPPLPAPNTPELYNSYFFEKEVVKWTDDREARIGNSKLTNQ